MSVEDEKVLSHYRNSIQGVNHLQFKLLWIEDTGKFKNNFSQAKAVLLQLQRKLLTQPDVTLSSTRFGEKKYGLTSDIENMFFQNRTHPDDRDMLRILWFDQPNVQGVIAEFQFQVAP